MGSLSASLKKYYEKLFGVECFVREGDEKSLVVESEWVHFFISQNETNADDSFISKQHLSFEVDNLDDVIQTLINLGNIEYKTGDVGLFKNRNYQWCEWHDPDGIRLECIEVK